MKLAIESVAWALVLVLMVVVGFNAGERRSTEAAYQQGYKDALYKRPASDDLELVCAGLWLSQLKPGEQ